MRTQKFKKEMFGSDQRLYSLYLDVLKEKRNHEDPWLLWGPNESRYKSMPCYYIPFCFDGKSKETIFIAYRPSTEEFPSEADFLFADVLIEAGFVQPKWEQRKNVFIYFEGSYITDFLKYRGKVADKPLITQRDFVFLKKEIQMIDPDTIVAIGNSVQKLLWRYRKELGLEERWNKKGEIHKLHHYAYPFTWRKKMSINEYKEKARDFFKNL